MNLSVASIGRGQLVDGEFVFTAEDFRRVAEILYADAGISLAQSKATLVYSRLAKRLRALGLESFRDSCALVSEAEGLDERQEMLAALTTNVTRFFREPHHFDHLRTKVMPRLVETARAGGRVRLWSAGCSTGPEPYSMAMTLLEALPEAVDLDVRILATDIDPKVVATARAGLYTEEALSSAPLDARRRWFRPAKGSGEARWRVAETLQSLVTFKELNLVAPPWPMKGRFDAIFCRNVMIYFDEPTQRGLVSNLVERLHPGGRLYIGHSERAGAERADLVSDGLTTYRRREAAR